MSDIYTNRYFEQMTIHGADENGLPVSGLHSAPFVLFNLTLQKHLPEPYPTYEAAQDALEKMHCMKLSLPEDGSLVFNQKAEALCIDGTNDEDVLESGCTTAPFFVFNIARQESVSGPFDTLEAAKASLTECAAQ
jgi:hypothetical protein